MYFVYFKDNGSAIKDGVDKIGKAIGDVYKAFEKTVKDVAKKIVRQIGDTYKAVEKRAKDFAKRKVNKIRKNPAPALTIYKKIIKPIIEHIKGKYTLYI